MFTCSPFHGLFHGLPWSRNLRHFHQQLPLQPAQEMPQRELVAPQELITELITRIKLSLEIVSPEERVQGNPNNLQMIAWKFLQPWNDHHNIPEPTNSVVGLIVILADRGLRSFFVHQEFVIAGGHSKFEQAVSFGLARLRPLKGIPRSSACQSPFW